MSKSCKHLTLKILLIFLSEATKLLIGHHTLTNKFLVQDKDSCVQDILHNPTQKRSLSCSDILNHQNSDRNPVVKLEISVSKSMPSMCTDSYIQYTLGQSNPSSTYDFALSIIHTTEETENNGTVVTNLSESTDRELR